MILADLLAESRRREKGEI